MMHDDHYFYIWMALLLGVAWLFAFLMLLS